MSTVLEAIAEADRLSGGDPTGTWRLLVLRMKRHQPEDRALRAAFGRLLRLESELARALTDA